MAIILDGKEVASILNNELKNKIENTCKELRKPHLAVILVGDDVGSQSYVRGKEKACNEVGIKNTTFKFSSNATTQQLLNLLFELNNDDSVDGILVQLPLPKHIDQKLVLDSILPNKDVDCFSSLNTANVYKGDYDFPLLPCTPKGIIALLDHYNIPIEGKNAVVIGRSNIVGLPVAKLLLDRNATVTICHSKTINLKEITSQADILIAAVGKPLFVTADMVKEKAVVIDVGINRDKTTNKLCGDVDFENVKDKTSYITKVPGGIGPMTICSLLWNTYLLYMHNMEKLTSNLEA